MWQHNYTPVGGSLAASALVAAIPVFVLFLMLGLLRKMGWIHQAKLAGGVYEISFELPDLA